MVGWRKRIFCGFSKINLLDINFRINLGGYIIFVKSKLNGSVAGSNIETGFLVSY